MSIQSSFQLHKNQGGFLSYFTHAQQEPDKDTDSLQTSQPRSAWTSDTASIPGFHPNTFCHFLFEIKFKMGYSRKKQAGGGLRRRIYFFENPPGIFVFFTVPLEIRDKTRL